MNQSKHIQMVLFQYGSLNGAYTKHQRQKVDGDRISTEFLRWIFSLSGLTCTQVADRLHWIDYHGKADGMRVKRTLGMIPDYSRGQRRLRLSVNRHLAGEIVKALGKDPVDYGL